MFVAWYLVLLLLLQAIYSTTSTSWPTGFYGLLKPESGCPTGWDDRGFLFQDTKDTSPSNNRSEILHIEGIVLPSNVLRYFCVKKTNANDSKNWEEGQYCIYRRNGSTVTGMKRGFIRMNDEYRRNQDTKKFTGNIININTKYRYINVFFYCKINGSKRIPIELPITKPFYLLPYGSSECQQVKWMVATTEWIKYHTRNNITSHSESEIVPSYKLGNRENMGITMYYCYYKSCNYTLTESKGVFQSPGFPDKYPNGQLCSWRIMVPSNHTIHVHFTNFSLEENEIKDNLTFFKHANGSFQINTTYHGHRQPFKLTATNDVLFELLTNEEHNSTGFRAEYTISETYALHGSRTPFSITYETTSDLLIQFTSNEANNSMGFRAEYNTFIPTAPSTTTSVNSRPSMNTSILTIPTTTTEAATENQSSNHTPETFKKSPVSKCDGTGTTIAIVIPLVCLIIVLVVAIVIVYRWRSKESKSGKCDSRLSRNDASNPIYDHEHIPVSHRTSTATKNTTMGADSTVNINYGADDNDIQTFQALSTREQPEYEAPDYSKQNRSNHPNMDLENFEYHELEPIDNKVPDVVYNVLEGPDHNNGPSGDLTYQAVLEEQTTNNPLYETTNSDTMETQNHLYGSLA